MIALYNLALFCSSDYADCMNFIQSIRTCFVKFFDFSGRARRSEFWWFQLFMAVVTYGAMVLDQLLLGYSVDDVVTPLAIISVIVLVVPSASVMARRLHDIGWSGWVQLPVFATYLAYLDIWFPGFSASVLGLVCISGGMLFWIGLILILIKDSQPHTNKYGSNPKNPDMGEVFN